MLSRGFADVALSRAPVNLNLTFDPPHTSSNTACMHNIGSRNVVANSYYLPSFRNATAQLVIGCIATHGQRLRRRGSQFA